ncbi:GGDEF domain-containing protein [Beduini massiliensis]|uniref:GGDEF domain-containing protein n=1 Tax=Beduini massiliensis TaxID=1585974 RepID=UPI00059A91C9|nr:GGDEF domain-containing protein [Beduini massiliensis]
MSFIYDMVIVMEIILMNLYIFKKNVKAKYSMTFIIFILLLYTVGLIAIGVTAIKALGIYGNGNGLFTMMGFFYLLPLHYLFEGSSLRHFFIICFAWIYTLSIFSVSVQFGYIFQQYGLSFAAMITQSLLFSLTFYFVDYFVRHFYILILQCKEISIQKYLSRTSFLWFLTIFIINMHFIFDQNKYLKILSILILIINVVFNYLLIYEILIKRKEIGSLEDLVAKDSLTNLGSRIKFTSVIEEMIQKGQPFHLIFMDLNQFKDINDCYGHITGDHYLKEFARQLTLIAKNDLAFRISGDEFILLSHQSDIEDTLEKILNINFCLKSPMVKFNGVSCGLVHFPEDGQEMDELVYLADQNMYKMKPKKS